MRIDIGCGYVSVRSDRCSSLALFLEKQNNKTTDKEKNLREFNVNRIKRK